MLAEIRELRAVEAARCEAERRRGLVADEARQIAAKAATDVGDLTRAVIELAEMVEELRGALCRPPGEA